MHWLFVSYTHIFNIPIFHKLMWLKRKCPFIEVIYIIGVYAHIYIFVEEYMYIFLRWRRLSSSRTMKTFRKMWQWKGKAAMAEGYQRCKWRQDQGGSLLLPSVGQVCAWCEGLLALAAPNMSVSCGGLAWAGANVRGKHIWLRCRVFSAGLAWVTQIVLAAMEKREENPPCPAPWGVGGADTLSQVSHPAASPASGLAWFSWCWHSWARKAL